MRTALTSASAILLLALLFKSGLNGSPLPAVLHPSDHPDRFVRSVSIETVYQNKRSSPCSAELFIPVLASRPGRQTVRSLSIAPRPDSLFPDGRGGFTARYSRRAFPAGAKMRIVQNAVVETRAEIFNLDAAYMQKAWDAMQADSRRRLGGESSFFSRLFPNKDLCAASGVRNRRQSSGPEPAFDLIEASGPHEESLAASAARKVYGPGSRSRLAGIISLYDWLRTFTFRPTDRPQSLTEMLSGRTAQCSDAAVLTSKMLQSLGYKTRISAGFLSGGGQPEGMTSHSWCELYCPGLGFMPIDPVQGCDSGSRQLYFCKYDPSIIIWYLGPDSDGCRASEISSEAAPDNFSSFKVYTKAKVLESDFTAGAASFRADMSFARSTSQAVPAEVPQAQISGAEALRQMKAAPDALQKAPVWAAAAWDNNSIAELEASSLPCAALTLAWTDIMQQNFTQAGERLRRLPGSVYKTEALAILHVFTMQNTRALTGLASLRKQGYMSLWTAEAASQLESDRRDWRGLYDFAAEAARRFPQDTNSRISLMQAAFKCGDMNRVRALMHRFAAEAPQEGYPYIVLAQLYMESGQTAKSLDALRRARKMQLPPEEMQFCAEMEEALLRMQKQ